MGLQAIFQTGVRRRMLGMSHEHTLFIQSSPSSWNEDGRNRFCSDCQRIHRPRKLGLVLYAGPRTSFNYRLHVWIPKEWILWPRKEGLARQVHQCVLYEHGLATPIKYLNSNSRALCHASPSCKRGNLWLQHGSELRAQLQENVSVKTRPHLSNCK